MVQGHRELLARPRAQFLRDIMLNHWYQHRGEFSVYLRLLNVAVPAGWGPSTDENCRVFCGRSNQLRTIQRHGSHRLW